MRITVSATPEGAVVKVEEAVGGGCQVAVEGLTKAIKADIVNTELKPEFFQEATAEQKCVAGVNGG